MCCDADDDHSGRLELAADGDHALGDVLGEVADALEVAGDAHARRSISRRSIAIGWRRAMVRIARSSISRCSSSRRRIGGDHASARAARRAAPARRSPRRASSRRCRPSRRRCGASPAARRRRPVQMCSVMPSILVPCSAQPNRPGDVVLGALVLRSGEDRARSAPSSTSLPRWKKAVRCETRAACCIECVTMTMV